MHYPDNFAQIIANSFAKTSFQDKELAIRRYSTFWRLTGDYYRITRIKINPIGMFKMLEYLDHHNPLLRHSSKSWLLDSIPLLHRILDPIYEKLLTRNTKVYVTDN